MTDMPSSTGHSSISVLISLPGILLLQPTYPLVS